MENDIRKILVKLPLLGDEINLSFPFFMLLSEEFPKAEIHVLLEEGDFSSSFLFLPFKIKTHSRPRDKKNLIQTHKFVANYNEIFNIDLYLDLEGSFNSGFMGFNFRIPSRVGFDMGWNRHLLTNSFKVIPHPCFEKKSIQLLELYLKKNFQELKIQGPAIYGLTNENEKDELFKTPDQPKNILIMLDSFNSVSTQINFWKDFFDSFKGIQFVIWTKEDEDIISDIFSKIDLGENKIVMHRGVNAKEFQFLASKMSGVIVNNFWAESLAAYYNLSSISFYFTDKLVSNYVYFKYRPFRFYFNKDNSSKMFYVDEEKNFESINQVVDLVHLNFKL
jgi:hypothetical protein